MSADDLTSGLDMLGAADFVRELHDRCAAAESERDALVADVERWKPTAIRVGRENKQLRAEVERLQAELERTRHSEQHHYRVALENGQQVEQLRAERDAARAALEALRVEEA